MIFFSACNCNEEIVQILLDNGAMEYNRSCPALLRYDVDAACIGIYGKLGNKTVLLENEIKDVYGEQVDGFYILQSDTVNDKHYWVQENGTSALWMYKNSTFGDWYWIIGNKDDLGSSKGYLYSPLALAYGVKVWRYSKTGIDISRIDHILDANYVQIHDEVDVNQEEIASQNAKNLNANEDGNEEQKKKNECLMTGE